jgi:hypothetical protein
VQRASVLFFIVYLAAAGCQVIIKALAAGARNGQIFRITRLGNRRERERKYLSDIKRKIKCRLALDHFSCARLTMVMIKPIAAKAAPARYIQKKPNP